VFAVAVIYDGGCDVAFSYAFLFPKGQSEYRGKWIPPVFTALKRLLYRRPSAHDDSTDPTNTLTGVTSAEQSALSCQNLDVADVIESDLSCSEFSELL
jgi:hypothetical protein